MTPTRPDPRDTDPLGFEEPAAPRHRGYTFELWSGTGSGYITVPAPARWYLRWSLRFAAWLWGQVADATNAPPRPSRLRRLIGWWRGG